MKTKQIEINRFDLGMADEDRDLANGYFRYLENLEVGNRTRSVKQVSNIANTTSDKYIMAMVEAADAVYGLGQENSTTSDCTIYKATGTSSTVVFGTITNGTATGYNRMSNLKPLFEYYNGKIYYSSVGYIGSHDLSATNTANLAATPAGGISGGCIWQGKIWGWNGQTIYEFDPADNSLTEKIVIPQEQTIVDVLPYGNYMMIICKAGVVSVASKAYIWDGVTTTTFADIVEIGYGIVAGADTLDGQIYVVMGFPNKKGFRIKRYNGNVFTTEVNYNGKSSTTSNIRYAIPATAIVRAFTGYIYFLVLCTRPGSADTYEMVIFRYGRKDTSKQNSLSVYKTLDFTPASDVSDTAANSFLISELYGANAENYPSKIVVAYITEGGSTMRELVTTITSSTPIYSAQPGILESAIYTGGDSSVEKKLTGVAAQFVALGTASTITVEYKKDEDLEMNTSAWTTVLSEMTSSAIAHESVTIETAGTSLPYWNEIAFRVSILGGAELTGLKFKYEDTSGLL